MDSSETLTDSYAYTPYGKLTSHDGNATNSFLFTGEQFDADSGGYYLRARYYSPNFGRFLSRDSYDGRMVEPITLNHYLYTGSNPIRYIDPSGHFFGVMASMMRPMVFAVPRMAAFAARPLAASGVRALPRTLGREAVREGATIGPSALSYIYVLARFYARFGDHTNDDMIPIQVYGSSNLPEHQAHIEAAMLGLGSNRKPTTPILHKVRKDVNNRNFLGRKAVCGGYPRVDGQHCDEYPYNSTFEGGTDNFDLGNVSVRLVNGAESRMQGRFIKKFYDNAPVGNGDTFLVIPLGGTSGFFDKRGLWNGF